MASPYTTVNLARLSAPAVVEQISYETILDEMISDFQKRMLAEGQAFTALLESDPVYKVLEVAAYREMLLRQRANESAKATMLAFARGSDLDHIGANFNVSRLLVEVGNPNAIPPTRDVYEQDEDFRGRIPLSLEGYTTAGSEGSYIYHGLSADGDVKDVSAVSPSPTQVTVYVLSRTGDGTAPQALLDSVEATLNAEKIRPLTDRVTVLSSSIVKYKVRAELILYPGPSSDVVESAALAAVKSYTQMMHRNGYDVSLSGLYQALHQDGVQRVNLAEPANNIVTSAGQAAYCTEIILSIADATDV